MPRDPDTAIGGRNERFPSTRSSLLQTVAGGGEPRRAAISEIVTIYWRPVYKYVRLKWNRSNEDAKDLTQGFFTSLLEQDWLDRFDPGRAAFRTYLRLCVDGYIGHQLEAAGRIKRGGGAAFVDWDFDAVERELQGAAGPGDSIEDWFHHEWQRAVFAAGLADLREFCIREGRQVYWAIFEAYDLAEGDRPRYEDLAVRHGLPATTVTNHLAWARRELRKRVLSRLQTVTAGDREYRDEAWRLFS